MTQPRSIEPARSGTPPVLACEPEAQTHSSALDTSTLSGSLASTRAVHAAWPMFGHRLPDVAMANEVMLFVLITTPPPQKKEEEKNPNLNYPNSPQTQGWMGFMSNCVCVRVWNMDAQKEIVQRLKHMRVSNEKNKKTAAKSR